MKLRNKRLGISILLIASLVVGLAFYVHSENTGSKNTPAAQTNQEFTLTPPALSPDAAAVSTFLNQEAGMAIWLNATAYAPLNLNAAKSAMVIVENATSTYVIGSLSDNGGITSSDDYPHCYVDQSGWIVVYYLKVNTQNQGTAGYIGKIIDWRQYSNNKLNGNYLTEAMNYIALIVGIPSSFATANEQYYHFQYPTATELMFAIKSAGADATATFNINVPSSFTIYEYSWACYAPPGWGYGFEIDSNTISSGAAGTPTPYGGPQITAQILTPDVWHTIYINGGGEGASVCLILLYS
jgi:hypothetical protein